MSSKGRVAIRSRWRIHSFPPFCPNIQPAPWLSNWIRTKIYFSNHYCAQKGGGKFRHLSFQMNLICLKCQFKNCTERYPIAWVDATITKRATVNFLYWFCYPPTKELSQNLTYVKGKKLIRSLNYTHFRMPKNDVCSKWKETKMGRI